jgi:hypothetical protein
MRLRCVQAVSTALLLAHLSFGQTRPPAKTPPKAVKAEAKPAITALKPNALDGTYRAVTSQQKDLVLTIKDDKAAEVSFAYTIPGGKCFPVTDGSGSTAFLPELNNSIRFTLNPETAPKLKGNQITVERSQSSGGPNAAPIFELNGKFSNDGTVTGTLDLTAIGALHPPDPPCQTKAKATFKGRRAEDASPAAGR